MFPKCGPGFCTKTEPEIRASRTWPPDPAEHISTYIHVRRRWFIYYSVGPLVENWYRGIGTWPGIRWQSSYNNSSTWEILKIIEYQKTATVKIKVCFLHVGRIQLLKWFSFIKFLIYIIVYNCILNIFHLIDIIKIAFNIIIAKVEGEIQFFY